MITPEIEQLIHDVLHGEATAADRQRLSDWITSDESNAAAYLRVAMDERGIRTSLERSNARSLEELASSSDDSGAGLILAELARAEANARPPLVEIIDLRSSWPRQHAKLLGAAAGVALAALIALAVILLIDDPKHNGPAFSLDGQAPANTPGDVQTHVAAKLTAERGAVWQGTAGQTLPVVGESLSIGRRLVLVEGSIELTTHRGAVAIVQAPCEVRILGDNKIALDDGTLLGICETQTSKGFVVRTPHMDITDLGTRFGVDVSAKSATEVHVIAGLVQAVRTSKSPVDINPMLLAAGDAVRASVDSDVLSVIASDVQRFASFDFGDRTLLGGTGLGLAVGDKDPNWQVVAIGGDPLDEPVLMGVTARLSNTQKLANAVPGVQYLKLHEALVTDIGAYINDMRIRYTVRSTLVLPDGFDPSRDSLVMQFEVDDRLLSVRLNGQEHAAPPNQYQHDNNDVFRMAIPGENLRPGPNTIELEIEDLIRSNNYVWGLGIAWHLEARSKPTP